MKHLIKFLLPFIVLLSSCRLHTDIVYLQNVSKDMAVKIDNYAAVKIQPQDELSIAVYSKVPELAFPFNLNQANYHGDMEISVIISQQRNTIGYIVDKNGEIDFPTFGKIQVAGLTREELSEFIKNKLITENYINDPIVMIQFLNFRIFVAGEVANPGMYEITNDRITLLEALAMAGDLTIHGKRDNVKIIREESGERKIYIVDLRTADLFNSLAYYLQQNDYIYVEFNHQKIKHANRK